MAQPVATKSTDRKKGCSGLGCLLKAFGSLVNDAKGAASDLTSLAEKGASWAAGELTDSDLPGAVGGLIGSLENSKLNLFKLTTSTPAFQLYSTAVSLITPANFG
jgi:hypothetical protein